MSRLFTNSGCPLTTFRITIKGVSQEQIKAERQAADQAFLEDREVSTDPDIAYESDMEICLADIVQFIQRLEELEYEFRLLNS